MSFIEVNHLSFEYIKDAHTLEDISFAIEQGEYVCILGHNGSGKSTIAKLIIGLLEAKSGTIQIDGIDLNEKTIYDIRSRIGIVFQNPDNQFIGSTVRDDIAFGLENKCVAHEEMEDIIQKFASEVDMLPFLDHEPSKLSGGQKQRVAIAGILAMSPSILILDESTSMLDPKGKKEINDLVSKIRKEKKMTVISITHDIEEASLADRIILLDGGHIKAIDCPGNILTDLELLKSVHLDTTFAYQVSLALHKKGLQISPNLYHEGLVNALCQLHSKK